MSATSATRLVKVVGVSFVATYPDNLTRLYELVDAAEVEGERLTAVFVRNPANPYDANAVEVHVPALGDMAMIGHVDRDNAARLAPRIDNGDRFLCGVAGVRIDPQHPDRPGIDIAVTRLLDSQDRPASAA